MTPNAPSAGSVLVVADGRHGAALAEVMRGPERTVEVCDELGEAMARVAQGGLDLVVLDLDLMPGDAGLTLVDVIRLDSPESAVVVLAGPKTPELVGAALDRGASCALVRPADPRVVAHLVELTLRSQQGVSAGRMRAALEAIDRALIREQCVARLLEWAGVLTESSGAAFVVQDEAGELRVFSSGRSHTEQVAALGRLALDEQGPIRQLGTVEERERLGTLGAVPHGPALAWPLDTEEADPCVLAVVREQGAAPFHPQATDVLASLAAHATLALDRLAATEQSEPPPDLAAVLAGPVRRLEERLAESIDHVRQLEGSARAVIGLSEVNTGLGHLLELAEDLTQLAAPDGLDGIPLDKLLRIAMRSAEDPDIEYISELPALRVTGQVSGLAKAFGRLVAHAVAEASEAVVVRSFAEAGRCHVVIKDDGGGRGLSDGLGLLEARRILEHGRGALTVERVPSDGTRIEVVLPMAGGRR